MPAVPSEHDRARDHTTTDIRHLDAPPPFQLWTIPLVLGEPPKSLNCVTGAVVAGKHGVEKVYLVGDGEVEPNVGEHSGLDGLRSMELTVNHKTKDTPLGGSVIAVDPTENVHNMKATWKRGPPVTSQIAGLDPPAPLVGHTALQLGHRLCIYGGGSARDGLHDFMHVQVAKDPNKKKIKKAKFADGSIELMQRLEVSCSAQLGITTMRPNTAPVKKSSKLPSLKQQARARTAAKQAEAAAAVEGPRNVCGDELVDLIRRKPTWFDSVAKGADLLPGPPDLRSSHGAVVFGDHMLIYGGEYPEPHEHDNELVSHELICVKVRVIGPERAWSCVVLGSLWGECRPCFRRSQSKSSVLILFLLRSCLPSLSPSFLTYPLPPPPPPSLLPSSPPPPLLPFRICMGGPTRARGASCRSGGRSLWTTVSNVRGTACARLAVTCTSLGERTSAGPSPTSSTSYSTSGEPSAAQAAGT